MATTAQNFYPNTTDQDQSWGTDVRKLDTSAPGASDGTTILVYSGSTSGPQYPVTADPYTTRGAQSSSEDTRTNLGWAWNEDVTDADAMDSETASNRVIPSGTWTFTVRMTISAPAALATVTVDCEVSVYRVATGGGTRTLIFSMTSNSLGLTSLSTLENTYTATGSQSEIVLAAGETLHVAYRPRAHASASVVGGTTNTTLTFYTGTQSAVVNTVQVPSPGVRTRYIDSTRAATAVGVAAIQRQVTKAAFAATAIGTAGFTRLITAARTFSASAVGVADFARVFNAARAFTATAVGVTTFSRAFTADRRFTATAVGVAALQRTVGKIFSATAVGVAALGPRTVSLAKSATAVGVAGFSRSIIAARAFAATAVGVPKAFVTLLVELLPPSSGVTTIVKKLYLFDD